MPVEIERLTAPGSGTCGAAEVLALAVIESVRATRPDAALNIAGVNLAPEVPMTYWGAPAGAEEPVSIQSRPT